MKIALFDYVVSPRSPAGSCDVRVVQALRDEHEITVFSSEFAMPGTEAGRVRHVTLSTVSGPSLASFLVYFARACMAHVGASLRGRRFDLVQVTDCSFPTGDICYAHFCHRAFLAEVWPRLKLRLTPRALNSWGNSAARAVVEARLVRTARVIVVPSAGLARDFTRVYPEAAEKLTVIRNTVDLAHFARPIGFESRRVRPSMRTQDTHTVFVFVALGHFERKGLPILLEGLADRSVPVQARLWVVGGEPRLVASYRAIAESLGVTERVTFAGRTDDVRPYLWSADAFVAPSHYEAFSLGLLEAAAAGLPLIATRISGSEELLQPGINGLAVESNSNSVAAALRSFLELDPVRRRDMGRSARESVEPLRPEHFAAAWRALYASFETQVLEVA
jgi:glycosyltransferase involved in cell wall biosynthesis